MEARALGDLELVYVWADGMYVKAGLEKDKAAMLVVIGAMRDGTKVVLAVESGLSREDGELGDAVARSQGARAASAAAGGRRRAPGIWGAAGAVFPEAREQRCWNHRIVNVLDTLPKKLQARARELLSAIPYAPTRAEAPSARAVREGVGARHPQGGRDPGAGLGAAGGVLRLPEGALEAPADDERGGVPVRGGAAADRRGQAVQEGRERDGDDLEDAAGRRAELPPARRAGPRHRGTEGVVYDDGVKTEGNEKAAA